MSDSKSSKNPRKNTAQPSAKPASNSDLKAKPLTREQEDKVRGGLTNRDGWTGN